VGEVSLGRLGLEEVLMGESSQGRCVCPERVAVGRAWELPTRFAWVRRATILPAHGYPDYKAMSL